MIIRYTRNKPLLRYPPDYYTRDTRKDFIILVVFVAAITIVDVLMFVEGRREAWLWPIGLLVFFGIRAYQRWWLKL